MAYNCVGLRKMSTCDPSKRAEPDIFIWGDHWRGQFCNKGSCQWSV